MENSPLGRLAPELRNRIYEISFQDPFDAVCSLRWVNYRSSLTRTCRKMRSETHAMFYASCLLRASAGTDYSHPSLFKFCALLRLLGPSILCQLRSLTISIVKLRGHETMQVDIVGQDKNCNLPGSSPEPNRKLGPDIQEGRDLLFETLASMGLNVRATVLNRGSGYYYKEKWVITKPELEGTGDASEQT